MISYRAAWVVPIAGAPLRDGAVLVDRGRIVQVSAGPPPGGIPERDLGMVALLPGLVNAHTHLELSYLRGQIPIAERFTDWIRGIIAARRQRPDAHAPEILGAVDAAVADVLAAGTAVVADISNTLVTLEAITRSGLAGVVFYELLAFRPSNAAQLVGEAIARVNGLRRSERVRASLAAHAPYSVAPEVFQQIHRTLNDGSFPEDVPWSVHLAESAEEIEFISRGTGPWRRLLEDLGSWDPAWRVPGNTPLEYLDGIGVLDDRVLVVHGVHMTREDLRRIVAAGTTIVTCPRSNRYTGAGTPPVEEFYRTGARVAVGTDSLASTDDLNLFSELAELRRLAPPVPARMLLESATSQGARALGLGADYGTIERGKRARIIAVAIPDRADDVEEYLVSGVQPEQIRWIDDTPLGSMG